MTPEHAALEKAYVRLRDAALAVMGGHGTHKAMADAIKDYVQPGYAPEKK